MTFSLTNPVTDSNPLPVTMGTTAASAGYVKPANMSGLVGGNPTYRAVGVGFVPYATPTDLFQLLATTKKIIVTGAMLQMQSTAAAVNTLYFLRRTVANTGGSPTLTTPTPMDSTNAAATATMSAFTAAPSALGATGGNLLIQLGTSSASTAAPGITGFGLSAAQTPPNSVLDTRQGFAINLGEAFCLNLNSAAVPGGSLWAWAFEWIEP